MSIQFEIEKITFTAPSRTLKARWQLIDSPQYGSALSGGFISILPPPPEIVHLTSALMFPAFVLRIDKGELAPRAAEALQWVKDSGFAHEFQVLSSEKAGLGFVDKAEAALFKMLWVEAGDAY